MDVLPLPPRPNLEQYKKRAKDLAKACRSTDPLAVRAWAADWLQAIAKLQDVPITPFVQGSIDRAVATLETYVREKVAKPEARDDTGLLADAQFLIARAHGFESWPKFAQHVEHVVQSDSDAGGFEAAADAVVSGDLPALASLLRANPELVRSRSTRSHHATLLHYVAANGVEDFRQKSPKNAPAIAKALLDAGAEVDALADSYGGGKDQTTMNLLVSSTHPADAGVQETLVETLLDFGAAINGLEDNGSPLMTALAFGYGGAAETLERRGARVDNVIAAAALGRADLVRSFVIDERTLAAGVPFVAPRWLRLPDDAKRHIELACVWACRFGRMAVVDSLLGKGVDPAARDTDGMTLLHWAAATGPMELIQRLLERGAPLEVKNTWGGTVLDSTLYFAMNQPTDGVDYLAVAEALIAAGADVAAVSPFPTGNQAMDELLRRHGARSESSEP